MENRYLGRKQSKTAGQPAWRSHRRRARQRNVLTVRFVCPVCGGTHARADHPIGRSEDAAANSGEAA